jgi:hypothetical protein
MRTTWADRNPRLYLHVLAISIFAIASVPVATASTLLSTLVNGSSISAGGVTFSGFESFLNPSQQNQIALDAFINGPNDIALRIRPPDLNNNPYGLNSQNCVASPGSCPASPIDVLTFNVNSSSGPISSVLMFAGFQLNDSGNSFYNDGTVSKYLGNSGPVLTSNCYAAQPNPAVSCNGLVATSFWNGSLGPSASINDYVTLQFSGQPLATGYRVSVTGIEQHFLLNGVTVQNVASGPTGGAILSNASLVLFPVPSPPGLALLLPALAVLAYIYRGGAHSSRSSLAA